MKYSNPLSLRYSVARLSGSCRNFFFFFRNTVALYSTPFVRITHIDGDNSNNRIWNLKTYDSSVENDSDSDSDSDINETKKQIKFNERMAKIAK